jgi:hypothetical protein
VLHLDPDSCSCASGFVAAIMPLVDLRTLAAEAVELRPGDIMFAVFDGYGRVPRRLRAVLKVDPVTGGHADRSAGTSVPPASRSIRRLAIIVIDRARPRRSVSFRNQVNSSRCRRSGGRLHDECVWDGRGPPGSSISAAKVAI